MRKLQEVQDVEYMLQCKLQQRDFTAAIACRPLEDLNVCITGGVHFDLVKRVLRDINRSGQAPEEIIQQVHRLLSSALQALVAEFSCGCVCLELYHPVCNA